MARDTKQIPGAAATSLRDEPPADRPDEATPLLSGPSSQSPTLHEGEDEEPARGYHDDGRDAASDSGTEAGDAAANHSVSTVRGIGVGLGVFLFISLLATNFSGMSMIQGSIADDLASHTSVLWLTTSFLIPASSLSPVAGRVATIFGPRALIPPITILLALGGLICAFADSFAVFVLGRVVGGTGAAGVLTLAVIVVLEMTGERRRGLFVGLVNAGMTVGVSFGAVVYGALLPVVGWRPLFWSQTPLVIVAGLVLYFSFPGSMTLRATDDALDKPISNWHKARQIDYVGALLLTLTIVLFLYGLAGDIKLLPILLSPISLLLFTIYEFRVPANPIIPLRVLSSRGALLSCLAQVGVMSARWTVLFYTPIFMLSVYGLPPARSGSILIPTNLGFAIGGLVVGALHIRRSGAFYGPSLAALVLTSLSLYALSAVATSRRAAIPGLVTAVFCNGFVTSAFLNYTLAHLLHLSPRRTEYVTTSLMGTFRGFGGSFGTSIGGGIFYRVLRAALTDGFLALDGTDDLAPGRKLLVSRLLGTPTLVHHGGLSVEERDVAVSSYLAASKGVWMAAAGLTLLMLAVQAGTGWTAPQAKEAVTDEVRANVVEHEGVGEV